MTDPGPSRTRRPRIAAVDDEGRPIVAELGRAETPAETAARKAAATAQHRGSGRSVFSLLFALLASFAIVAFLVLVVVRPDAAPTRAPIDYVAVAEAAQAAVGDEALIVPELPEGWSANRAELVTGAADGVDSWQIGFVTPEGQYLALTQGFDANPSWLAELVFDAPAGSVAPIGGLSWTSYDRRDADEVGNVAYALAAEVSARSTLVIAGTASDGEFAVLAEAVGAAIR